MLLLSLILNRALGASSQKQERSSKQMYIHVVEKVEKIAVHHLADTDDDGHLHFVRVQPRDLILSQLPDLMHARMHRHHICFVV